jgi:hypothetical protein
MDGTCPASLTRQRTAPGTDLSLSLRDDPVALPQTTTTGTARPFEFAPGLCVGETA